MLELYSVEDLEALLAELRVIGADHQWVEAKAAKTALPSTLWQSVIAFANSDQGGLVLLGVDENGGAFDVVGVDRPGAVAASLTALCTELEPPLRPAIRPLPHPGGTVISALIAPVPRSQMPCHKPNEEYSSSYVRVGDSDNLMTRAEVDELRIGSTAADQGRRPAPAGATVNHALQDQLIKAARVGSASRSRMSDTDLLYRVGVTDDRGALTLAGLLAIGHAPEVHSTVARVSYRETPTDRDPVGARFVNAGHVEGTVGDILDELLDKLIGALRPAVVVRDGEVRTEPDIPVEALREMLGNALVHRSLSPGQDATSTLVEVSPTYVLISNPGGVHPDVSLRNLGLSPLSTPRNRSLATACEYLRTPSGQRITEGQASGIPAADRACHDAGTAPALFSVHPTRFSTLLLRGRLPVTSTQAEWGKKGVSLDDSEARLYALATAVAELHNDDAASDFSKIHVDAVLAARALAPCLPERAPAILSGLEVKGVLRAARLPNRMIWTPVPSEAVTPVEAKASERSEPSKRPSRKADRREQVGRLLEHLHGSEGGHLRQSEIREMLGVAKATAAAVVRAAIEAGLVEASSDVAHDPTRTYRLTTTGKRATRRS